MSSRNNKLYNYLVNTFGLSAEKVREMIVERIDHILDKKLRNFFADGRFKTMLLNKITGYIRGENSFTKEYCSSDKFEDVLRDAIREEVAAQLNKGYRVEVVPKIKVSKEEE